MCKNPKVVPLLRSRNTNSGFSKTTFYEKEVFSEVVFTILNLAISGISDFRPPERRSNYGPKRHMAQNRGWQNGPFGGHLEPQANKHPKMWYPQNTSHIAKQTFWPRNTEFTPDCRISPRNHGFHLFSLFAKRWKRMKKGEKGSNPGSKKDVIPETAFLRYFPTFGIWDNWDGVSSTEKMK